MERISLLVFSRDNVDKVMSLVDDMYDHVDEVVVVDSSGARQHSKLLAYKKSAGRSRLTVLYAIALGYPDPLRMYALKKCRYEWVLMVDTDERLSDAFKDDLHSIIKTAGFAAFSVKRYEDVKHGRRGSYTNWQTRLFKKSRVEFRGIIHEGPRVSGDVERLPDRYYIDHVAELRQKVSTFLQYREMERFLRMSYKSYNERIVDYFYKTTVPSRPERAGSFGGTLHAVLQSYQRLRGKHSGEEVSNFDYYVFYYIMTLAINLKLHRISSPVSSLGDADEMLALTRKWRSEPDSDENFEISKILYDMGLIKFLGLDKEETVIALNRKYRNKKQGIELLIALMKDRYRRYYSG